MAQKQYTEDNKRLSDDLYRLLRLDAHDGASMIATSRAILRERYSNEEYSNVFFDIFILIDEETGDVVLDGFGDLDVASARHAVSGNFFLNAIRSFIATRRPEIRLPASNDQNETLSIIEASYANHFSKSLRKFRSYFQIGTSDY